PVSCRHRGTAVHLLCPASLRRGKLKVESRKFNGGVPQPLTFNLRTFNLRLSTFNFQLSTFTFDFQLVYSFTNSGVSRRSWMRSRKKYALGRGARVSVLRSIATRPNLGP